MSYREELIEVYARTLVADIETSADYQNLSVHSGDRRFQAERDAVEKAKVAVEMWLEPRKTGADEVKEALRCLVSVRADRDRDLYYELIARGYKPDWTEPQRVYFEEARKKIQSSYEFFLSFTTRYAVPGENPVNTSYEHFIRKTLGPDAFEKADRTKTNLLAHVAFRLLSQPDWPGFYFVHSQYDNSPTEPKLEHACLNSLIFVQLVQNIMFAPPTCNRNYCHWEYTKAMEAFAGDPDGGRRILFVIAERDRSKLVPAMRVHPSYQKWHKEVLFRDPPYLPEAEFYNEARIQQLKEVFTDKIRPQIDAALERIIDRVPL